MTQQNDRPAHIDVERLARRVDLLSASLRSAQTALADVARQVEGVSRDLADATAMTNFQPQREDS